MSLPRCLALLLLSTGLASAADKLDFERITPVPADQPVPVQDFFRPPLFSNPILNASGTHFVARVDVGHDRTALLLCDLAKNQLQVINGYKNEDVDWITWLDDTHILTSLISDKHFAKGIYVTNVANAKDSYAVEFLSATALVGVPAKSPMRPIVWIYHNAYDDGHDMGAVQLDAGKRLGANADAIPGSFQDNAGLDETGKYGTRASIAGSYPKPPGKGIVADYLADKDGELAFAVSIEDGVYSLYRYDGKKWTKCPVDLDTYYPLGAGDKPGELIVLGPRQDGRPRELQRLDAVSGQLGEVLAQDQAYDITSGNFYRHPVTHQILGVKYLRSALQTLWLDEGYAGVQKMIAANFPGQVVSILGSNRTEDRFFFYTYSDRQPVTYFQLDLKAKSVGLIKKSAPWIDPARMQPTNVLKLKSRDGHPLECYLTLPAGASKTNPPPTVVLAHGGPHARDAWGYDGEVQFLASRGYGVLQVNYRGSTGYNWMFGAGDAWDFRKMHEDVTDATNLLVKAGFIDGHRLAIMGSSFGGYLALCGAAFEPDQYRCAVTIAGVFDWRQVFQEKKADQYDSAAYGIFLRALGDPEKNREQFDAISPLRHVDQIKVPVFVAHGKDDEVADVRESRALIDELEKHHVDHESLIVSREGHGMSFAANEVELYTRIEAFLAKNLKGAK